VARPVFLVTANPLLTALLERTFLGAPAPADAGGIPLGWQGRGR